MSDEQDQAPADPPKQSAGESAGESAEDATVGESEEKAVPPPAAVSAPPAGDAETLVANRYRVDFLRPYPEYDTLGGTAYVANDREDSNHAVYALVCHPGVPQRHGMLEAQNAQTYSHMLCVEASGLLPRRDGQGVGRVLIFPRPEGGRIEWDPEDTSKRLSDDDARKIVVPQLLDALDSLVSRDQTHRRVNPYNIFFEDKQKSLIVLGECVSEPAGASQPAMFEPVERAMASVHGRGEGTPADDMYAFGVTLYCLLRGGDPFNGKSAGEVNRARLFEGTWVALGGGTGIPPGYISLLHGLLSDDPEARWSLREVQLWIDGTAPRARSARRTARVPNNPIEYLGNKVPNSRSLAFLLSDRPGQGTRRIREKDFVKWVCNGLRDAPEEKVLSEVIALAKAPGKNRASGDLFLLARICQLLDPEGPLRLGQLAFFVDGLGPVLAAAFKADKSGDIQTLEAGFGGGLLLDAAEHGNFTNVRRQRLDAIRYQENVMQKALGYGLQRCLYEACPSLACQSPAIERYHTTTVVDFAADMETEAGKGRLGFPLIDAHIAAFLGSRTGALEVQLGTLRAAGDMPTSVALATLDLMEAVQRLFWTRPMPALAALMCRELDRVIELVHSKKRRALMLDKINTVRDSGSLTEVARTMDFPAVLKRDREEYQDTIVNYANNEIEIRKLRSGAAHRVRMAQATGYGGVAAIGALLLTLVVSYLAFGGGQ